MIAFDYHSIRRERKSTPRYLPTPEEIQAATAKIRESWTEADYRIRSTVVPDTRRAKAALEHLEEWTAPTVSVDDVWAGMN